MKAKPLFIFGAHALLGLVLASNKDLAFYWGIAVLVGGSVDIIFNRNANNRAGYWAAYYMGMEVFLRMTNGMLFYEFGKYGVVLLLSLGIFFEPIKKEWPRSFVFYFVLLLPSILVTAYPDAEEGRQEISFNLSGPLSLAVAVIYFYKRALTGDDLRKLMMSTLLPLAAMAIYLFLVTPKTSDVVFTTQSNFTTSGGFGPNQVSTALGLGILLSGIALFYRYSFTGFLLADAFLIGIFLFRGLVTFSRGGVIAAVLALAFMIILTVFSGRAGSKWISYILFFLVMASGIGYVVWDYVNESTDQLLTYRYTGVNPVNNQAEDLTSNRLVILEKEWALFTNEPVLGIGPGMGKYLVSELRVNANSHSELTRLLAEHGLFGLASLLILVIFPYRHFKKMQPEWKPMLIAFLVLSILTMSHSAMRLAMPGFLFGLSFIVPASKNKKKST